MTAEETARRAIEVSAHDAVFTVEQWIVAAIREAEREAADEALEKAALAVEEFGFSGQTCRCHACHPLAFCDCAKAVRSLKSGALTRKREGER